MNHLCADKKLLSAERRTRADHRHAETFVYIIGEYYLDNFNNINLMHELVAE